MAVLMAYVIWCSALATILLVYMVVCRLMVYQIICLSFFEIILLSCLKYFLSVEHSSNVSDYISRSFPSVLSRC